MSALRTRAVEYLAMRRALGFKLETQGPRLMSFVGFCEERGAEHVTADMAITWATQTNRGSNDEVYQARRLDTVRIFARHLQALDPATEVPPEDVLSRRYRRIPPYLYSPDEVAALMSAADGLTPAIRAATWRTLIGLLAVTGMRQGEACHLGRDDVDTANSLPPLALWTAFPSSTVGRYPHDYYGGSATSRPHQSSADLPTPGPDGRLVGRARDASHVHRVPVDG